MRPKKYILVLLSIAIFSCQKKTVEVETNSIELNLEALIDSIYQSHPNGIGFILHVEAPDKNISWGGAAGYSDRKTKQPLLKDQPGQIGSITKTFTAVAIFRLIEMGKLELNQPIKTLLPERTALLMNEKGHDLNSITIAHLLSHRGGMPNIATEKWLEKEKTDLQYRWSRDEQIRDAFLSNSKGMIGEFHYSDINYCLLTEIMEKSTETSFYLAMRDLLKFEELGINNTWFYTLEQDPEHTKERFHQYKESRNWISTYDENPTWGLNGASGLVATAKDLALFSQALASGNIYEKPETLDLMYSKISGLDYKEGESSYRMGIAILTGTDSKLVGHDGYWGSFMFYLPDQNASFAFYGLNADELFDFDKLNREISEILK